MQAPAQLIRGQVIHERLRPARNKFVYPVFFLRVNLERLSELNSFCFGINRWRLASLYTRDYGPRDGSNLKEWISKLLQNANIKADGEVWLQTFPRLFGFVFNPVSFWYCYDKQGGLRAVLAEVNNTFGETYSYLISAEDNQIINENTPLECLKRLHVSPFCEVRGFYRFRFRDTANTTLTGIDYYDDDGLLIKTAISGHSQPFTNQKIFLAVSSQPFLTIGIVFRILWQAFRLWIKRVPFFTKPERPSQN